MSRKVFLLALAAFPLCFGACVHAPKYQRPALPVLETWPQSAAVSPDAASAPAAASVKWQDFFTDKNLQEVISLALKNNRDLRVAALDVEKVQAEYRIRRAQQYPTVSASATGDLYRIPRMEMYGFSIPQAVTVQEYTVNVGVTSWEVDLFGRVRSLKSAALESFLATEQSRSATQIALVAAVANTYLTLAGDRENLRLAQKTLDAQRASYELIRGSRETGIASDLDLRQAQSQVEAAQVEIARYTGQVDLDENALNLLVGAAVCADLLPGELGSDQALKDIAPGMPSQVLLQRPDILAAEHQLKAAYANIGAARAAYFPQITLTGGGGLVSSQLHSLFQGNPETWSFAPQIALPIFDMGTRRANVKIAQADRDIAVAEYEKTIQSAFREVSDSLALRTRLMEQQNAQQSLVNTLDETYRLSDARYKTGIDNYLSVLVAQRSLYAAQQGLVGLRLSRLSNLVTLYKVLGGGA